MKLGKLGKLQAFIMYRAEKRGYAIFDDFKYTFNGSKEKTLAKIDLFIFEGLLEEIPNTKYPIRYKITDKGKRLLQEYREAQR
jgi:DNA-binding PadR family transcriptional regulator